MAEGAEAAVRKTRFVPWIQPGEVNFLNLVEFSDGRQTVFMPDGSRIELADPVGLAYRPGAPPPEGRSGPSPAYDGGAPATSGGEKGGSRMSAEPTIKLMYQSEGGHCMLAMSDGTCVDLGAWATPLEAAAAACGDPPPEPKLVSVRMLKDGRLATLTTGGDLAARARWGDDMSASGPAAACDGAAAAYVAVLFVPDQPEVFHLHRTFRGATDRVLALAEEASQSAGVAEQIAAAADPAGPGDVVRISLADGSSVSIFTDELGD